MKKKITEIREKFNMRADGGPGSGNWGHEGRPGEVGGSGGGGGIINRYVHDKTGEFTSFAKMRNEAATPHQTNAAELKEAPYGTKLVAGDETFTKIAGTKWFRESTGEVLGAYTINKTFCWDEKVKLAVPKSAEEEFMYGKATKSELEVTTKSGFSETGYTDEQVDNAKIYSEGKEVLDAYKGITEACWDSLDQDSKDALYSYTTGSSFVNEPLHEKHYTGYKDDDSIESIKNITAAIDKCEVPKDTIMYHGVKSEGFASMLGISYLSSSNLDACVGKVFTDNAFVSCGTAENTGFQTHPVLMEIFVPEGSKGMFVEPFSAWGNGAKSASWDGVTTQKSTGWECETILQRGGSYLFTGYKETGSQYVAQFQLVGQNPEKLDLADVAKYTK